MKKPLFFLVACLLVGAQASGRQSCANQIIDNSPEGDGASVCVDFYVLPQRGIWAGVFGPGPLWQMTWAFPTIDFEVTGVGQYYGVDHLGRAFTLNVLQHRAFSYGSADFAGANLSQAQIDLIVSRDARLYLVAADLYGGAVAVPVWALCMSATGIDNQRHTILVVLSRLPEDIATEFRAGAQVQAYSGSNSQSLCAIACNPTGSPDCQDPVFCYSRQFCDNQRAQSNLADCDHEMVAPYTLPALGCFFLCLPAFSGTPLLYLTCLAGCEGVLALSAIVDHSTCIAQFHFDKDNAHIAYCNCIAWKQLSQNCPGHTNDELPIGTCP